MKRSFLKTFIFIIFLIAVIIGAVTGCRRLLGFFGGGTSGGKFRQESTGVLSNEAYPGTISVWDVNEPGSKYLGIMHVSVIDIQPGEKDGKIYKLMDRNYPDDAWTVSSRDIGDMITELSAGSKAAVMFHGDIINDSENLEFILVADDANYAIKKAEGTLTGSMVSAFTIRTSSGTEMNFVKDNCYIEKDALAEDGGGKIVVYYADNGGAQLYPLRVYKKK